MGSVHDYKFYAVRSRRGRILQYGMEEDTGETIVAEDLKRLGRAAAEKGKTIRICDIAREQFSPPPLSPNRYDTLRLPALKEFFREYMLAHHA